MSVDKREVNRNIFGENLLKFCGREVVVRYYEADTVREVVGKCEAVDLNTKGLVVRNDEFTYFFPKYVCVSRRRVHPPVVVKKLVKGQKK